MVLTSVYEVTCYFEVYICLIPFSAPKISHSSKYNHFFKISSYHIMFSLAGMSRGYTYITMIPDPQMRRFSSAEYPVVL